MQFLGIISLSAQPGLARFGTDYFLFIFIPVLNMYI